MKELCLPRIAIYGRAADLVRSVYLRTNEIRSLIFYNLTEKLRHRRRPT